MGVLMGDDEPQPVIVGRVAEPRRSQWLREKDDHLVVGYGRGHAVGLVHGVHEHEAGLCFRLPLDPGHEPRMGILGDARRLPRRLFAALVKVDQEMGRFERRPRKGRIKLAKGRRGVNQESKKEEDGEFSHAGLLPAYEG